MYFFNIPQINKLAEDNMTNLSVRELQIESEHPTITHPVEHLSVKLEELQERYKSTIFFEQDKKIKEFLKRISSRAKALEKGKKALANGKGYLMPYKYKVKPSNVVRLIYYKNSSTSIDLNEALSILMSSGLKREQIEMAVQDCGNHSRMEIYKLFKILDEKEHLDSLIQVESFDASLIF